MTRIRLPVRSLSAFASSLPLSSAIIPMSSTMAFPKLHFGGHAHHILVSKRSTSSIRISKLRHRVLCFERTQPASSSTRGKRYKGLVSLRITSFISNPSNLPLHTRKPNSAQLNPIKPLQSTSIKMQFSIITAILAGATMVAALPADMSPRQSVVCPGTDSTPQCCAVNVLDLADLNCANRKYPHQPIADPYLMLQQLRRLPRASANSPLCAQPSDNRRNAACYLLYVLIICLNFLSKLTLFFSLSKHLFALPPCKWDLLFRHLNADGMNATAEDLRRRHWNGNGNHCICYGYIAER